MRIGLVFLLLACSHPCAFSQTLADSFSSPELWRPDHAPFSFKYAGKDSAEFLKTWQTENETAAGTDAQVHFYSCTDPVTHLKVTAGVRHDAESPESSTGSSTFATMDHPIPLSSKTSCRLIRCLRLR